MELIKTWGWRTNELQNGDDYALTKLINCLGSLFPLPNPVHSGARLVYQDKQTRKSGSGGRGLRRFS